MINRRRFLRALAVLPLAAVPVRIAGHRGTRTETAPGQFVFCFPEMKREEDAQAAKRLLESRGYVCPVVVAGSATRHMEIFRLEPRDAPRRG